MRRIATNQSLVEMAINDYLCAPNQVPKTVSAITALLDAKDKQIDRLLNIARGCHDYGGGYSEQRDADIYHHGIQTVINALEFADDDSLQTRVLERIGQSTRAQEVQE